MMNGSHRLLVSTLVLLGLSPAAARAQDSQYWTQQYGPVAELLGGVVVGSTRDLSATFYNPGALSLTKDPSLLASVQSFESTAIKATSVAPVIDFQDSNVRPAPSLFAFALPRSWTGSSTVAISSLTRQDFDLRMDNWQVTPTGSGGAEALFDQSLTENWFGLSWGHKAGERLGVGVTTYVVYRGQRTRKEVSGEGAVSPSQGGSGLLVEDFDFAELSPAVEGGGGDAAREVGSRPHGDDLERAPVRERRGVLRHLVDQRRLDERLDRERGRPAPGRARVALRFSLVGRRGRGLSTRGRTPSTRRVEWFDKVGGFDVLDTSSLRPAPARPRGSSSASTSRRKSVVNFGFGYERRVSDRFSCYGAFTTDFTYADKGDAGTNALSTWDIYHVTAGTSLMVGQVKLTMGAAYAFGSDSRAISTLVVPPGGQPVPRQAPLDVKFSRLRVLVGFDFGK